MNQVALLLLACSIAAKQEAKGLKLTVETKTASIRAGGKLTLKITLENTTDEEKILADKRPMKHLGYNPVFKLYATGSAGGTTCLNFIDLFGGKDFEKGIVLKPKASKTWTLITATPAKMHAKDGSKYGKHLPAGSHKVYAEGAGVKSNEAPFTIK